MEVAAAFAMFEVQAIARGWAVTHEAGGPTVRRRGACLRMRLDEACVVWLEISHGPADGEISWLDLWSTADRDSALPSLTECVEYGLDLMQPALGHGADQVAPAPRDC